MQDTASGVRHFIEFVNAANTVVGQDQRTRLEDELAGFWILCDVSSQTHCGAAFTGSVLGPRDQVEDVLEQLGLAGTGITAQQDVDLGTERSTSSLNKIFLCASEQLQQDALLDVFVFVNGWSNSTGQTLINVGLLRQFMQKRLTFGREPSFFAARHENCYFNYQNSRN